MYSRHILDYRKRKDIVNSRYIPTKSCISISIIKKNKVQKVHKTRIANNNRGIHSSFKMVAAGNPQTSHAKCEKKLFTPENRNPTPGTPPGSHVIFCEGRLLNMILRKKGWKNEKG